MDRVCAGRVAALYDIHGNLPALEAVLVEVRRANVDGVVIGGDVVPGPMPRETIACLRALELPLHFVRGNGEREVLAWRSGLESRAVPESFREVMRWNAEQLSADDLAFLSGWPSTLRLRIAGLGEVLFCHASPRNDTDLFTRLTNEAALLPLFETAGSPLVICGHSHMPFDRTVGTTRVINAGSVGMPVGEAKACWLLLGLGVAPQHTPYDLAAAAERVRATDYPQAKEFARRNILQPPSEAETLAAFARVNLSAPRPG